MLTLAEAAVLDDGETHRRGVLEEFVLQSTFMDMVPFFEISGNSYKYNMEDSLPGVEYRAVNSAYAESTGTFNEASEGIVIAGGEADVDTFIQRTQGRLADQRALQEQLKVKALVEQFQRNFIHGSVVLDANSFDGLQRRIVGSQVLDPPASADFIQILGSDDDDRHLFLDQLDELLSLVPGIGPSNGVLIMNEQMKMAFMSATRRLTITTTTRDELGRQLDFYRGIRLVDPGESWFGDPILPQTEPDLSVGETENTSSIYAVRFGRSPEERAVTGLTNGGVQVEDLGKLQSKPAWRTRIEFFHGLGVFGGKAAARMRAVKR